MRRSSRVRVFGPGGGRFVDTDENRLADRVNVVAALKRDLAGFSPTRPPGQDEQGRLIAKAWRRTHRPAAGGPIRRPRPGGRRRAGLRGAVQLSPDGELLPGTVEILCEVLRRPYPFRQQAAAWSLGYLGPAASRAVTRLLATLDAAPRSERDLVERTAFAVPVAIVHGTPDEDRVIARLVEARKSAEDRDRPYSPGHYSAWHRRRSSSCRNSAASATTHPARSRSAACPGASARPPRPRGSCESDQATLWHYR